MNDQRLKEDLAAVHIVFDLCGVPKTNRQGKPHSLRMRALMLADSVRPDTITQQMIDERLGERLRELEQLQF